VRANRRLVTTLYRYFKTSRCRPLGGYSLIGPVRSLCC